MMDTQNGEEPPARSNDLEAWRQAVSSGRFRKFKAEKIVAAIQDLGLTSDDTVLNALALHISDTMMRILRNAIGRNHRNEGSDLIADVHGQLIEALLKPGSADGKGLRKAFVPRVRFRAADALRKEQKTKQQERSAEGLEEIYVNGPSQQIDPRREMDEGIDVERALERVADERKRLAFRLHMEGFPVESRKSDSISEALGVSDKTASQWIAEVQSLLSKTVGEEI